MIRDVVYYDEKTKRARLLSRMADVWICPVPPEDLIWTARSLCHDHDEPCDHATLTVEPEQSRRLSLAMRVIQRHGHRIQLERPGKYTHFGEAVLKRDELGGVYYTHILSDEASDFREACYVTDGSTTVATATLACRLTRCHARNWAAIVESNRFKIASDGSEDTCDMFSTHCTGAR